MANQMPIYSQVVPKSQYRNKNSKTSRSQGTREFDPLNFNNGGNFLSPTDKDKVDKGDRVDKDKKDRRERYRDEASRSRRTQNRNEASESKVEAYLRQNQVSIRQQQHRHSAVRQAEHRVNLRSLQLNDVAPTRGHDRTPTERHRGFPGDKDGAREHRRERDKDRDRDRDRDNYDFDGTPLSPMAPRHESSRPVRKSSSAHRVTETNISTDKRRFFCREWAFQKIAHCLEQRAVSNTAGALILGDAGSGKTALCQELSSPSPGPQARQQRALNRRLLARHFLQSNNENSLRPSEFIRSLAMQILSHSSRRARNDSPKEQNSDRRNSDDDRESCGNRCGLLDDTEEINKPLLADSEDQRTDEEENVVGRRTRTIERIHERAAYTDSMPPSVPEVLPRSSQRPSNPFVAEDQDLRLYENHENLFLRNISHNQSKEARLLRQSSEPTAQKTNSSSDPDKPRSECSPPKSRIPVANFRYPNKSELRPDNSPQRSRLEKEELPEYQNVIEQDEEEKKRAPPEDVPPPIPTLPISARTAISDAYYDKLLSDPDIQRALLPHQLEKDPDGCFKRALLFPLLEITPPKQGLFLLVDAIDEGFTALPISDAYYDKLLSNPDIQRALLPHQLKKDPDGCFKRALLFPLLEITPPKQGLFLLVDAIDEGFTGNDDREGTEPATTVATLLARHQHLLPQWLLLVVTARRHARSCYSMFTGYRKVMLDELQRAHVSADVQRYVLARLDTEPRLRSRVSSDAAAAAAAAAALDNLRIKSDGCLLYLEKVLDGVADGFIALREIREIPGTLNGLYLWLAQRLFHGRRFTKVRPLLDVLLAARCGVTEEMLYKCLLTKEYSVTREDFNRRLHLLRRILVMERSSGYLSIFHHSFASWLSDVKHCTRRYLCCPLDGHAQLAMYYTLDARRLTALETHNYVFHMTTLEQHMATQKKGKTSDQDDSLDLHTLVLLWVLDSGCDVEAALEGNAAMKQLQATDEKQEEPVEEKSTEQDSEGKDTTSDTTALEAIMPELVSGDATGRWPRDKRVFRTLMELSRDTRDTHPLTTALEAIMPELVSGDATGRWPRDKRVFRTLMELSRDTRDAHPLLTADQEPEKEKEDLPIEEPEEPELVDPNLVHELANKGDDEALASLLKRHPNLINATDATGGTALHAAARGGKASTALCLLRAGADASVADADGWSPLRAAAWAGHSEPHHSVVVARGGKASTALCLLRAGADASVADADGWSPLRAAAWAGHSEVVEVLLEFGCDVDCVDADNRTALRAAAWSGHETVVAKLLAAGADGDKADAEGRTPLIAAAYMGHADIVRALLDAGCDVDHADEDGRTALSVASLCASGGACAAILIERGASVSKPDRDRATPLLVAAFEGHTEICELLLEAEADIEAADVSGRTALWAAASAGHARTVRLLLFWGACVDNMDAEGRTVLSTAAAQGNVEVVRQLLDRGLDEHHRDNSGWTPLHYAAFEGHIEVCEALLEAGAKVDEADNDGKGALMLGAQEGHSRLVELLIDEWGAPVDQHAHDGKTALRLAALEGHFDTVRALHERGADVDALDADRRSTLYVLALDNRLAMARFLLKECGASVAAADNEGRTPLHVSAWQGHTDMVNLLIKVGGAEVDGRDRCARTALHAAAWRGRCGVLRTLLQRGADPAAHCTQGATPLGIAAQEGHEECVLWLLQHGADPMQADHCGRTPAKVAWRAGHAHICRILERWASAPSAPPQVTPKQPPAGSPEYKRRSVHSSNSTKSSSNLTGGSGRSHEQQEEGNDKANRANLSLTFAQQVARCGRGRREKERESVIPEHYPLQKDTKIRSYVTGDRECSSPLYASPPHSPTELCSPTQHNNTFGSQPPSLTSMQPIQTDTHFNRDTHMRIILGRDSKPVDRNDSSVSKSRQAYNRFMGSLGRARGKILKKTKNKRNGIVTNPAMRLVANVRNGLDSAAANIRRTGVALAASASSANPAVKTNAFQWRKETPL